VNVFATKGRTQRYLTKPVSPKPSAKAEGHLTTFKQVFYTYVSLHLWLND
jgi:hypothetical protein